MDVTVGATTYNNTLYFDCITGDLLSRSNNQMACKLNEKGLVLSKQSRFAEAKDCFFKTYLCASNCKNESIFKNNMDRVQVEVDAINLNSQGNALFNDGRYTAAQTRYQAAHTKSTIVKEKDKYIAGVTKAQVEIDAITLNRQGDTEFNAGRYDRAKVKYQKAVNKSNVNINKIAYTAGLTKIQDELYAIGLEEQGDILFNEGKYADAQAKYQAAHTKSIVAKEKDKYIAGVTKAQVEVDAIALNCTGNTEFNTSKHDRAKVKPQETVNKSNANKIVYTARTTKVQVEIDAIGLKEQGDRDQSAFDNHDNDQVLIGDAGILHVQIEP